MLKLLLDGGNIYTTINRLGVSKKQYHDVYYVSCIILAFMWHRSFGEGEGERERDR